MRSRVEGDRGSRKVSRGVAEAQGWELTDAMGPRNGTETASTTSSAQPSKTLAFRTVRSKLTLGHVHIEGVPSSPRSHKAMGWGRSEVHGRINNRRAVLDNENPDENEWRVRMMAVCVAAGQAGPTRAAANRRDDTRLSTSAQENMIQDEWWTSITKVATAERVCEGTRTHCIVS